MTMPIGLRDRILTKAAEDGEYRALLIADPKAAISAVTAAPIPDGVDVVVHEDSATTFHLVLASTAPLTEAELAAAAGGDMWGWHL